MHSHTLIMAIEAIFYLIKRWHEFTSVVCLD